MKRTVSTLAAAAAVAALSATPAAAGPNHLHCMTSASGKVHSIARGVTLHAPHDALHTFHANVHAGAFAGRNPHLLAADAVAPYAC